MCVKTKLSQKNRHKHTLLYTVNLYGAYVFSTGVPKWHTCVLVWVIMFTSTCKIAYYVCRFDTIHVSKQHKCAKLAHEMCAKFRDKKNRTACFNCDINESKSSLLTKLSVDPQKQIFLYKL